jgi:hypothetical protein
MNDQLTPQESTQDQSPDASPQEQQDYTPPAEPQDTQPQEPQSPDEKLRNDLQAWMGRKLKEGLEERDERLFGKIAGLFNEQQVHQPQFQPQQPYQDQDPEPDPDIDVREWYEWRKRQDQVQEIQSRQFNDQTYFGTLNDQNIKHPDEKIHKTILEHMQKNQGHNQTMAGPMADATMNYARAMRAVTEQMIPRPQNPLQNNQPPGPGLGTSQPSATTPNVASMPRLSPQAQKLVARAGWDANKVRKALGDKK